MHLQIDALILICFMQIYWWGDMNSLGNVLHQIKRMEWWGILPDGYSGRVEHGLWTYLTMNLQVAIQTKHDGPSERTVPVTSIFWILYLLYLCLTNVKLIHLWNLILMLILEGLPLMYGVMFSIFFWALVFCSKLFNHTTLRCNTSAAEYGPRGYTVIICFIKNLKNDNHSLDSFADF